MDEAGHDYPVPIADALAALRSADSLHERRDRVVECFRALLRYASAVSLAVRVQFGAHAEETSMLSELLRSLRQRGLTDGQWVGLMRGLAGAHAHNPEGYPLPALAALFRGKQKKKVAQAIDGLLEMRKAETVAHGATGSSDAILAVLQRREPQLDALLAAFAPVWQESELVVPLARPEADDEPQMAWRLRGYTPRTGKWPRVALAAGVRLEPGEPVLVDRAGKPRVSLAPIALFRRPSPEAVEELFVLDGAKRNAAVFVAFPSMAEHREKDVWAELGSALLSDGAGDEPPPSAKGIGRPFRGLSSFGPEHAAVFFGRERQAEALANRIRRHPMITVTGPSGSGKSSLLSAGVFPLLEDATVIKLRPGPAPIAALERRLSAFLGDWPRAGELARVLSEHPETLGSFLEAFARERERLIVLEIDQAEEVFTLCSDAAERHAFAEALASAGLDPDGSLRVVIALREDFFARLSSLSPLSGLYTRQVEVVTTPAREDLIKIIFVPLSMFGFSLESEELAEAMLTSVAGEPAALAMLQFCLDQLWERRDRKWKQLTLDAYRALGGVEGALAAHAEEVLAAMPSTQRALARGVFMRLVTEDGTRAVVSREALSEATGAGHVIDKLIEARLCTSREGEGEELVELVHEALLRHWERLRDWLADDEVFVRTRARVSKAASRWQSEGHNADLLLGEGKPLMEARELLRRRDELGPVELAFIDASEARSRRATRLKRLAVLGLAVLTVIAGGFGVFAWQQRGEARRSADAATENANIASARLVELLEEQGRVELVNGNELGALVFLTEALERGGDGPALRAMIADASRPADAQRLAFDAHGVWSVSQLAFSPDGELLASADPTGKLCLWRADSGDEVACWKGHDDNPVSLSFTADTLVSRSNGEPVKLWSLSGKPVGELSGATRVSLVAVDAPRQRFITAAHDGKVRAYALSGGEPQSIVDSGHEHLGFGRASGRWLAVHAFGKVAVEEPSRKGRALIWDLSSLSSLPVTLAGHDGRLDALAFSPEGDLVASGANDGAMVWRTGSWDEVARLAAPRVRDLAFDPRGEHVVTAGYDNVTRIWNASTGKMKRELSGHRDSANPGSFTPAAVSEVMFVMSGEVLASRGSDAAIRLFDPDGGTPVGVFGGHHFGVSAFARRPGTDELASGGEDGRIILWSLGGRRMRRHLGAHLTRVDAQPELTKMLAAGPSGNVVAAHREGATWLHGGVATAIAGVPLAMREDGARVLAFVAPELVLSAHDGSVDAKVPLDEAASVAAFHPTGALVAIDTPKGELLLVDLGAKTKRSLLAPQGDEPALGKIMQIVFSEDGKHVAAARRGAVFVIDVATGKELFTTEPPKDGVSLFPTCAFHPAGDRIMVGTSALSLDVYSVPAGDKLHHVHGNRGSYSADGKWLASAETSTPTVWVHDAATGRLALTLDGHQKGVGDVRFTRDGGRILTASDDGTVRIWETRHGRNVGVIPVDATAPVTAIHLDASGTELLTASRGALRIWNVAPDARTVAALDELIARASPYRLDGARLVPRVTPEQALARSNAKLEEAPQP